jgi:DNA-directed RNA polymerase subunit L
MEQQFDLTSYVMNANLVRGTIINEFNKLEKTIEYHLANHMQVPNEKRGDFMNIILDRLTFEGKRTSLRALNEKIETVKGFNKTKNNSYPNSKLFEEIRLLNDERNHFAHYLINHPTSNKGVIGLTEFRDNYKVIWYSEDQIFDITERIHKAIQNINDLFEIH